LKTIVITGRSQGGGYPQARRDHWSHVQTTEPRGVAECQPSLVPDIGHSYHTGSVDCKRCHDGYHGSCPAV